MLSHLKIQNCNKAQDAHVLSLENFSFLTHLKKHPPDNELFLVPGSSLWFEQYSWYIISGYCG